MTPRKTWTARTAAQELEVSPGYIRQLLVLRNIPTKRRPMPAHPGYYLEISNAEFRKLRKFLDSQSDGNKRKRRPENGKEN